MKITKRFTAESSHIVRNCSSHRCRYSLHGHSYVIDLTLTGHKLDNANMLVDFGLLKGSIKEFIDSMDHCHVICGYDDEEYVKKCQEFSERWILLPFNPSAEMLAVFFFAFCQHILDNTEFNNGEDKVRVHSVTVHETATGWAEADASDYQLLWNPLWFGQCGFSEGVVKDWGKDLRRLLIEGEPGHKIKNPKVKQQIVIPV